MKKLTLCFVLLAFAAKSADLTWDDPNPAGVVKAFRVWREEAAGSWVEIATVTTNRWRIVLPAGAHRIAVSAVGSGEEALESSLSQSKAFIVLIQPTMPRIEQ